MGFYSSVRDFPNGMPEEILLRLCNQRYIDKGVAPKRYGISEMYSQGRVIREYSGFPEWLPLCVNMDHGAGDYSHVLKSEIEMDSYAYLAFSRHKRDVFRRCSDKPCYQIPHPFTLYRRINDVRVDEKAYGTISFPAHSSSDIKCNFDVNAYIGVLKTLPVDMQPVSVCLFSLDVLSGMHIPFIEAGIPVYTAGNISDIRFVDRYYDILHRFKYATSNCSGSYVYYSVEMGIPFSIVGEPVAYFNEGNIDWKMGDFDLPETFSKDTECFNGIHREITECQKRVVQDCFDCSEALSGDELRSLLYKALRAKRFAIGDSIKGLRRIVRKKIISHGKTSGGIWDV